MKQIIRCTQLLYGSTLLVLGLNTFLHFLPIPEKTGFAKEFLKTLHQTVYLFPLIAGIMVTAGVALLLNRFVTFGALILLPVSLNIFLFHLFHDAEGLLAAIVIYGFNLFFIRQNYSQIKRSLIDNEMISHAN